MLNPIPSNSYYAVRDLGDEAPPDLRGRKQWDFGQRAFSVATSIQCRADQRAANKSRHTCAAAQGFNPAVIRVVRVGGGGGVCWRVAPLSRHQSCYGGRVRRRE